jgi:hypothetical protein
MCFVDFTYNRENDKNYRNNMVTALEVFDSLQENIKKLKEGQFDSNNNSSSTNNTNTKNVRSSGSKNSLKSNGNSNNSNSNSGNKNSFIINDNFNTKIKNNKININNNNTNSNIYSFENSKSNSKTKKKTIENNNNLSKERKPVIKINNNGIPNMKAKPINVFSNKSHYIPVSNNKTGNMIKANSRGKPTKKQNEIINNINKKIISHPSSASGGNKPMNNSGVVKKNVKIHLNTNNIPTGKNQINKIGKMTTASVLNKSKPVSAKLKK